MKQTSPIESPKSLFNPSQGFKGLQVPKSSPNVIRNLGINFEDFMPGHSDPTSPNFQRMNDILKSPSFQGSKPISMILPDGSQNSWVIPLQEQCLETSMPFEDLIGQLESPKLSDKMQMIFNSNVNLSESIMKNTFRAVDESRVKLEDKDLQVELEISELKLHHLEKKVEGCLASSKTTLAMNAQLSQNVSRMVSPVKSSHGVLTTNIRTRSNSRVNTPRGNREDSLSPFNSQLLNNKREALPGGKSRPKSVAQRIGDAQGDPNSTSFPLPKNEGESELTGQDNIFARDIEIQKEKMSISEKRVKSVSIPIQESGSRLKDNIINEAYQKLNSYFGPGDVRKSQPDNQGEKRDGEVETIQTRDSHSPSKSTELIMSNNITFYTNLLEREGNTESEEHNKNRTRVQSQECLSEDQDHAQKQNFVFGSKPRESASAHVTPLEPRTNIMPREVPLVGADGKERIFILKPKETLRVERLESIFIIPVGNKGSFIKPSKVRSQFSSFQCSETEECSQIKENLRNAQLDHTPTGNQTVVGSQSRVSFFDNSNIASMNLDRTEPKPSGFSTQTHPEPLGEASSSQNQKEVYLNNLKLQILNHPKCQKFFAKEDTMTMSTRGRTLDIMSKENDGMEFYFKQKINDFREFLNEFEKILPTETSVSPGRELGKIQKKIKQVKSCELQEVSPQEDIKKEATFEYGNIESKTVENTPRELENEGHECMKEKYNSSMKKSVSVIGCVASPQNNGQKKKIKFVNFENNEAESHYLSKEGQFSGSKGSFNSPTSGFNSPVQSLKKKAKTTKSGSQKESLQIPSMSIKLNKGNHSITIPTNQVSEKKRTHDKSASMKSFSQQVKNKKSSDLDANKSIETKKLGKNITRGNSKSIVEAVTLNRIQQRANSVIVIEK